MHDRMNDDEHEKGSSTHMEHHYRDSRDEGLSVGKLISLSLILGAGYLFVKQLPELQRYLKMRQM